MPDLVSVLSSGLATAPDPVWDRVRLGYLRLVNIELVEASGYLDLTGRLAGEVISSGEAFPGLVLGARAEFVDVRTQLPVYVNGFPLYGQLEQVILSGGRDYLISRGELVLDLPAGAVWLALSRSDVAGPGGVLVLLAPNGEVYLTLLVSGDGATGRQINPSDALPVSAPAGTVAFALTPHFLVLSEAVGPDIPHIVCRGLPGHKVAPGVAVLAPGGPNEEQIILTAVPDPLTYLDPIVATPQSSLRFLHNPGELVVPLEKTAKRETSQFFLRVKGWDAAGHIVDSTLIGGLYDFLLPKRYTLAEVYGNTLLREQGSLGATAQATSEEGVIDPTQLLISSGGTTLTFNTGYVTVSHGLKLRGYTVAFTPVWGENMAAMGAIGLLPPNPDSFSFHFTGAGAAQILWTMLAVNPLFTPLVDTGVASFAPGGTVIGHAGALSNTFVVIIPEEGGALGAAGIYGTDAIASTSFTVRNSGAGGGRFRWLAFNAATITGQFQAISTATFGGSAGVTITHNLNLARYDILLTPVWDSELPGVGDYGVEIETKTPNSFVVKNTGANVTSQFKWAVLA